MKKTTVVTLRDVELKSPLMIEGLPGVGHVGKLVADHLIEELKAEKIVEIYSPHFPPQVIVEKNGTVRLVRNEVYAYRSSDLDLLIIAGDHQSTTTEGHYELCNIFLNIAEKYNVKRIYTLGGYGVGKLVETETVLGAVNRTELIDELESYGVEFKEEEPAGGIIGVSGLLIGLAGLKGIDAACLMGVTSGYLVDPKSARSILKILCKALDLEVDMKALDERAREMEKIVAKLREMEQGVTPVTSDEDLRYIG
ncbi:PAC2 family protein [Candidatus Methanoperedenaceae archaeon GB37]|nr:PAC2 family protein [Candidatus Methanoperedenaceae archaeon GB37]